MTLPETLDYSATGLRFAKTRGRWHAVRAASGPPYRLLCGGTELYIPRAQLRGTRPPDAPPCVACGHQFRLVRQLRHQGASK